MSKENFFLRLLVWRIKHISNRNFLLFLSVVVGIFSGLAAVFLKEMVHLIQHQLFSHLSTAYAYYSYLAYPLIGISITVILARYIFREAFGHGITDILYAISRKSSHISRSKTYSNLVGSAITVGFGGSVGLEAPIVVTGSAIGSNIGRLMHIPPKKKGLLIGCGTAAAISAIFNSPIAGVIFSIEVILIDVTINAFIPLLIASVTGSLTSLLLLGDEILFSFKLEDPFSANDTVYYILLGIFCGLVSVYFTRITYLTENLMHGIQGRVGRAILGGVSLGLIIFIFPPIYGEGYDFIKMMLAGNEETLFQSSLFFERIGNIPFLLLFLLGLMIIKPFASALTISSGGNGGIFAPSLFIGAVTGFFFAKTVNTLAIFGEISLSNFTLVGMCGMMSGVLHAPLTAIFLIAELTSGYTLFVPLMLVSALSYTTILYFEKYSLYTKSLVKKGYFIPDDRDLQVLSQIEIRKLLETDLLTIRPDASLGDLVNLVRVSHRNIFPVVNQKEELVGIITLDDIRKIMFDPESQEQTLISSLMHAPPDKIATGETMQEVMDKFERTGAWNLPFLEEGKYLGLISKSRIFNAYRNRLMRQKQEY